MRDEALYEEVNVNVTADLFEQEVYNDDGDYVNTAILPTISVVVGGPGVETVDRRTAQFELSPDAALNLARALVFAAGVDHWEDL